MTKIRNSSPFRLPLLIIGLPLLLLLLLAALLLQTSPAVPRNPTLDNPAINTIEQLLVDNGPASISSPGELTLHLDADELNLLAAFLLQNIPGMQEVTADVALQQGNALVNLSMPLRTPLTPLYLNVHAGVRERGESLDLFALRLGRLPVPDALVHFLIARMQARMAGAYVNYQELVDLQQSLRTVSFEENLLEITLDWDPRLLARVQTQAEQLLLSADDKARIVHYFGRIVTIVEAQPQDVSSISLSLLLVPLFQNAQERVAAGEDPVTENRSLLQALSLYVNESDLSQLIEPPGAAALITPRRLTVTIQRRPDLAQHFTSSAAMSATVGAGVAGLLSTSKEVHDARYRTGFSFSDLTANSAGAALGNKATASPTEARQMQASVQSIAAETDYMPPVSRDNAGLSENDFSAQYTDRNSEAYMARISAIDEQIASLAVFQQP
ncbi:MAG: hypothetical protein KDI28_00120 [Pseudomonadales bacterium]|nr:hypothetical protein [Pseudomonadales bacterium]